MSGEHQVAWTGPCQASVRNPSKEPPWIECGKPGVTFANGVWMCSGHDEERRRARGCGERDLRSVHAGYVKFAEVVDAPRPEEGKRG